MMKIKGKLFVISAPSGAGKTTLIQHVLNRFDNIRYSVSHTTRPPRKNEREGIDYFFIDIRKFEKKIAQEHWLEHARVHDNYYGTSKEFVEKQIQNGQHLLLDIDVQGACQIMNKNMDLVSIFIMPPSYSILKDRLRKRATDDIIVIEKRLENAKKEVQKKGAYQYVVINDDLNIAIEKLCSVFQKEMAPLK